MSKRQAKNKTDNLENWPSFFQELEKESDRAAVLIGAAAIDEHLHQLLLAFLVADDVSENLFDISHGPLGSLGSKIDFAYSLGLLSEEEHNDLHIIRDIRNKCAHELHGFSFTDQSVVDKCMNLVLPQKLKDRNLTTPRDRLLTTCRIIAVGLSVRKYSISKAKRQKRRNVEIQTGLSKKTIRATS